MPETFWPSVTAAGVIVVVSVLVMGLVALFAVKVLRWPSAKTIARWERAAERNPNADGPMTPMLIAVLILGGSLPLFVGSALMANLDAPAKLPEYTGSVVEAGTCEHGVLELWWLYRCEAVVEITDREVAERPPGLGPALPAPPQGPVAVELLAREPVHAGAAVGLETEYDDGETVREWGLSSEADRPLLFGGMLAGWVVSLALSIPVGLWWRRSRPRPSPYMSVRSSSARRQVSDRPVQAESGGVEARGYAVQLITPLLLVTIGSAMWLTFSLIGIGGIGQAQIASIAGLLVAIPVVAAGSFKLKLSYDRSAEVLSVTRRFWFGLSRQWLIPLSELDRWYYVNDTQSLVLRRHEHKPLSFVLFMDSGGPERLVAWCDAVLPRYADPATGARISKRAKRAFVLGFGLGIPLLGVVAFVVLAMIFGIP